MTALLSRMKFDNQASATQRFFREPHDDIEHRFPSAFRAHVSFWDCVLGDHLAVPEVAIPFQS